MRRWRTRHLGRRTQRALGAALGLTIGSAVGIVLWLSAGQVALFVVCTGAGLAIGSGVGAASTAGTETEGPRMAVVGEERVAEVVGAILRGEVVAIPTDTVYGLVARADSSEAVAALGEMKGRESQQPVQLLVASVAAIAPYLEDPASIERVRPFWPGAVTAIVRVRRDLELAVVTPEGTVGVRQPSDALALAVIEGAGGVLAATSANRHGELPCATAEEVRATFGDALLVLDGGARGSAGAASTVVDLASEPPRILRAGPVSAADLGIVEEPSGGAREG